MLFVHAGHVSEDSHLIQSYSLHLLHIFLSVTLIKGLVGRFIDDQTFKRSVAAFK